MRGPEDQRDLLSPDLGMALSPLPSRSSSAAEDASGPSLALYLPPCGCNSEAPPTCLRLQTKVTHADQGHMSFRIYFLIIQPIHTQNK